MVILVTGANGQLGNEMRIISKGSSDKYIFTDVNQVEGLETIYLDITDLDAIRKMVAENNVDAIVNCAAWTNVDGAEDPEKYRTMYLAKNRITHLAKKTSKAHLLECMALPNFLESRKSLQ